MREIRNARIFQMSGRAAWNCLFAAGLLVVFLPVARAQQDEEQKGIEQGNYNIRQSIEFGGRFTNISGDSQAYNSFVNLQQGPRLLGFTMEMRSLDHHATLFDRLYFSNFGYGGEPNLVSRLRISKNKWYGFDALFRKDQNFWDYSLQANPLNPTAPFPNGPAGFGAPTCTSCVLVESPHLFDTRRKLGDYNLLLVPESRVRIRTGYSRNIVEGPVFSTIHQGTEQALFEDYKTTVNTYRLGVDFRPLPRTNISYDQIWTYYKGDTGTTDPNENPLFIVAGSATAVNPVGPTPVDLGVSFNAGANQPCGSTFQIAGAGLTVPAGTTIVNPACSAYFNYFNHGRTRTNTPTEQLSMQSNYWKDLDLSGRVSYSAGDTGVFGYNESLFGRESRTNLRNQLTTGPVSGRRVAATADFGATWHITEKLSFLDSFHFSNWHNPVAFDSSTCSFFSGGLTTHANVFASAGTLPLICAAPADGNTAAGATPVHTGSSGPDITLLNVSKFLKQDEKTNLAEVDYRFSQRFGARLGYRYRSRTIADATFAGGTFVFFPNSQNTRTPPAPFNVDANGNQINCPVANNLSDGTCILTTTFPADSSSTPIHEHGGLFGIWARPTNNFRINFDMELMSADKSFTRISPRQSQDYRIRSRYKVTDWLNLSGSLRILEARDNVPGTNNLQHDRVYGILAIIQPNEKYSLELGYDYNDVFSQIIICFVATPAPPGTTSCGTPFLQQLSTYTNKSHYGYFDAMWTPFHSLTARLGANLTGTSGSALFLNPNAVSGPLDSKWLHPFGGLDYHFAKSWTGKAYWDFYGYHEDPTAGTVAGTLAPQDAFAPRNFRGNLVTLSVRYAF
ncbi:MAG: hypothetical protein DMG35_18610 [Acidobacteria bacterium]|nr:MAG: hypothetical protein DMG35_18610 [Acidobacteriota bacterium]